jgi:hypothetical protein
VSLSQEPAYSELKNHFVCGYRNIMGERYAGNSGTHTMRGNAVDTTNGAGPHNIQMFVMNPDGTVLHCLPGYWSAADLASELDFGRKLNYLYQNNSLSAQQKAEQFRDLQLAHVRLHSSEMRARSQLQGFDAKHEAHKRHSDFVKDSQALADGNWGPQSYAALKTTDEVVHERMAQRPFVSYSHFDVAKFADYGTSTYDKHEDSLDENGRMIGEHNIQWIKNNQANHAMRMATRRKCNAAKCYVRNYGQLRNDAR